MPLLYLGGISTGDFQEALTALLFKGRDGSDRDTPKLPICVLRTYGHANKTSPPSCPRPQLLGGFLIADLK